MTKVKLPDEVLQVVIVIKNSGISDAAMAKQISRASLELRDKYDPTHADYVGHYEENYFKAVLKLWNDTDRLQEYYTVDDFADLREIYFQCGLESVPSSFLTKDEDTSMKCLVLGPFDKYRLEDLVQYAKFIE